MIRQMTTTMTTMMAEMVLILDTMKLSFMHDDDDNNKWRTRAVMIY